MYARPLFTEMIPRIIQIYKCVRFREKGRNAYIIKCPVLMLIRNATYVWLIKSSEPYKSMTDSLIRSD